MSRRYEQGTSTSNFGVGGRESHDASAFYSRFPPKELSTDETLSDPFTLQEPLVCGDSRSMDLPDNSVALVVTSPPYFAGKEYEEALGQGAIPATYAAYLELLRDVFRECRRVLEPGGRIAVNVANLGRKPYRSLAADVAGSGTTAVAAVRTARRYVAYDIDPGYIGRARARVAEEQAHQKAKAASKSGNGSRLFPVPGTTNHRDVADGPSEAGKSAQARAAEVLVAAGFGISQRNRKVPGLGLQVSLVADDQEGDRWYFDVTGAFTSTPAGLLRADTLWKCLGRASVLATRDLRPVVLLSSHLPPRRSSGDRALRAGGPALIHDVVGILNETGRDRLGYYARGGHRHRPLPGFWTAGELGPPPEVRDPVGAGLSGGRSQVDQGAQLAQDGTDGVGVDP